ncbi:MFS transporter [Candidatus Bathyarchaeota archaeon]|nr:MFS transporter [Candidatus Bathyarchaeota archaeon]
MRRIRYDYLNGIISDIAPQNLRGGIIGLYRTFRDFGGFIGPILFMISYEVIGTANTFLL